ncbi:MAG: PxKF domain-containing protein, partial [Myxococcota bacterium]
SGTGAIICWGRNHEGQVTPVPSVDADSGSVISLSAGADFNFAIQSPLRAQTLSFAPLADHAYGDPPVTVSATSSSGLPVSFNATGNCTVSGNQVTLTGVGPCTVTASQSGDATYSAAPNVSRRFVTLYRFIGFAAPVRNPPAINELRAGNTVQIRFKLAGNPGLAAIASGSPVVQRMACDTWAPIGVTEPAPPTGSSGLRYAAKTGLYTHAWKTEASWAGICQEWRIELIDGSTHGARFRFKNPPRAR